MNGFEIHRQAVCLQRSLNQAMYVVTGKQEVEDISQVYDRPVRLCADVLSMLSNRVQEEEKLESIQDIKRKYCRYYGYILSQMDEETLCALCEDLQRLCKEEEKAQMQKEGYAGHVQ